MAKNNNKKHYRTIWLSDIHLGSRGCQADHVLDFLKHHECDTLYLVGDIIDGWQLKNKVFWLQSHTNVLRKFLTLAKHDTQVIFVTGNHDEFLRRYEGKHFGNIYIVNHIEHTTSDGRRLLVIHGDQFDAVTRYYGWLAHLGSQGYDFLIWLNMVFNKIRSRYGYGYWSLSQFLKNKVKGAVNFISEYEVFVAKAAKKRNLDGVVCGHIHHAEIRDIDGVAYYNCGDWVESCTALVEDEQGNISIINWAQGRVSLKKDKPDETNDSDEGEDLFDLINGSTSSNVSHKS